MKFELDRSDIIVKDPAFLQLAMGELHDYKDDAAEVRGMRLNRERAMDILKENPSLAARLLSIGRGTLLWTGDFSRESNEGRTYGVRINNRKEVAEAEGDNLFGRFLMDVRDLYREYLQNTEIEDVPVREGQVIADFVPVGSNRSLVEDREMSFGERFIHTDPYQAVRFQFDASRDGTTGHSSRQSADEVSFHKFDCPFGTSYPYPLIVESAAEASMLYERALRDELDWEALFRNLSDRGYLDRRMTQRQRETAITEFRAQFTWMREQICNNNELKHLPIVSGSLLVPDSSLGRSVFDADKAPSPAHILARYINNPQLLFAPAENSVSRSLSLESKDDPERLHVEADAKELSVLVVGSDVIGGRQPGRKATSRMQIENVKDEDGNQVMRTSKQFVIPTKSREEIDADYEKFSARLDDILSTVPAGVRVRLVTGGSSTLGESVGIGAPRLVERYVREHGGSGASFKDGEVSELKGTEKAKNENLTVVLVNDFGKYFPDMIGAPDTSMDESAEVLKNREFVRQHYAADAVLCFSSSEDRNNRNLLSLGSAALSEGVPVIHVMENRSRDEQEAVLSAGALLSRTSLLGEGRQGESHLLDGNRQDWDITSSNVLAFVDPDTQYAVPVVMNMCAAAVPVGGASYHTVMGAYAALVAQSLGENSRARYASLVAAEGSNVEIMRQYHSITEGKDVSLELKERCMRQAVRMMMGADSVFADRILSLDAGEIVVPNSVIDRDLFVDLDGHGRNGFGLVLAAEREAMLAAREARRVEAEEERKEMLAEMVRQQKINMSLRAPGEKVREGLPQDLAASKGAVWFLGTNQPGGLTLPNEGTSFSVWDDMGGQDPLNRETAASPTVSDGEGGQLDNRFIFLFASSQRSVMKGSPVSFKPDSRDLTGLQRIDPATGVKYPCAFGIPVKMNNNFDEIGNDDHFPCSFRLDNDSSNFLSGVVIADTAARSEAFRRDMEMCILGRERSNGEMYYPVTQFFRDRSFGAVFSFQTDDREEIRKCREALASPAFSRAVREDSEIGIHMYSCDDSETLNSFIKSAGIVLRNPVSRTNTWKDNPHKAPINASILDRYLSILEKGKNMPLNCIPLASGNYDFRQDSQESREKAERRFVADLMMSLNIANSMAIQLGVPLRFPLDKDGRIDLGPNVPEEFRSLAEKRIDSFIGVVKEQDLINGPLPSIERISIIQAVKSNDVMTKSGQDFYCRPNDLVAAFGAYDFGAVAAGQTAPLHEMAFRLEDGTVFKISDAKLTRGMSTGEINKYIRYEKNDERRFIVRSTDEEKVPMFLAALESYIERAKAIKVETRLLKEFEKGAENLGIEGYINLLSSNSEEFVTSYQPEIVVDGVSFKTKEGTLAALILKEVTPAGADAKEGVHQAAAAEERILSKTLDQRERNVQLSQLVSHLTEQSGLDKDQMSALRERADQLMAFAMRNVSHDIGREMDIYNLSNRFDGTDSESVYFGKKDAGDAFQGYAQFRYTLPDGKRSDWVTIKDLELAGNIVLTMVDRKYRSDKIEPLSPKLIEMLVKSEAVAAAGEDFRSLVFSQKSKADVDSKVVSLGGAAAETDTKPALDVVRPVNVFAGTGENAVLSNFAVRPFSFNSDKTGRIDFQSVEQGFQYMKTYYSSAPKEDLESLRTMILSTSKGDELRRIGRSIPGLDVRAWDAAAEGYMRDMIGASFNMGRNPEACKALLATGDAPITHSQDMSRWGEAFPAILMETRSALRERVEHPELRQEETKGQKLYVSYFGSRSIPEDAFTVQIATSCPKGMEVDVKLQNTYPDYKTMVAPHKSGEIDDAEYTRRYKEQVLEPNKDRILENVGRIKEMAEGRDVYFLCYEKPGAFCHRYLLNNFLNENGIKCEENPADRKTYRQGHVQLVNEAPVESEPTLFTPPEEKALGVVFTESSGNYAYRTRENAQANDVDFTFAFAVDFSTYGERATMRAAGDSLISVDLPLKKDGGLNLSSRAIAMAGTAIVNSLPEEFVKGEPFGVNIAGNGMYTLARNGVTQEQADEFVTKTLVWLQNHGVQISSIRSGGQTGIDEAGIAASEAMGIPATVHAPNGWVFRGKDNVDVRNEKAFKERFTGKDLSKLCKIAGTEEVKRPVRQRITL